MRFRIVAVAVAGLLAALPAARSAASKGGPGVAAGKLDGSKDIYVDLTHVQSSSCGWGTAQNRASVTGAELRIGSATFDHGVGSHAPAELVYRVDGKYRWLTFHAGISEEMTENGSVVVQVWADGRKLHETPVLQVKEEPRYVSLSIAGVKEVRLVATDAGNGIGADHICFGNLRLCVGEKEPKPDAPKPRPKLVIEPMADVAPAMPRRGVASTEAAKRWEFALVSGNGRMGAMVFGHPARETIVANHCRLFLPLGSREILPDLARHVPELRRIIREKGYGEAMTFFLAKAQEQGFPGLIWTDPFHPGFELKLRMSPAGPATDYVRTQDFQTGEVAVRWREPSGVFVRRLFVSRPHNAIVLAITGPAKGGVSCELQMAPIRHPLIESTITTDAQGIACHNVYVKGKGGYDGAVRVVPRGGTVESDGSSIRIAGADEVLVLLRIEPFTKLAASSPDRVRKALGELPADYAALLAPHAQAHGEIFNRVSLNLGGGTDRTLTTEALLSRAAAEKRLPMALLEKMYDAGRYVFICSSGELPPNLQGIWTGTWRPAWSGDFTLDTNLQLAITSGFSANMMEGMEAYFRLIESFVPAWRENAKKYYGCRGVFSCTRASNTGLHLHWGRWPGVFWTCGAGWMAHWFHDYYRYTGDRTFLATRAVPLLKEVALFYEDFLFEDPSGTFRFSPSYSAENGCADNATQDIAVAREVLASLIEACETLKIEPEGVARWKAMLAKMPPYLVNGEGALKEWAIPGKPDRYNHRHYSHLYPIFCSYEFSPEATPELWKAARVALEKRLQFSREGSSHGRMHAALSAVRLRMGNEAFGRLEVMATGRSMYPGLVTSHEPDARILNVDSNGAIPDIVNQMLVFCWKGTLDLLPALPDAMPKGSIRGILCRRQIHIDRLAWDRPAGRLELELTSAIEQSLTMRLPNAGRIASLKVVAGDARAEAIADAPNARKVRLPAGQSVRLEVLFE